MEPGWRAADTFLVFRGGDRTRRGFGEWSSLVREKTSARGLIGDEDGKRHGTLVLRVFVCYQNETWTLRTRQPVWNNREY